MESLSTLLFIFLYIVFIAVLLAGIVLLIMLKQKWRIWRKEKKLSKLLGSRSLAQVLAESPYEFAHFQGEDGYRIYDKRIDNGFVDFAPTTLDAQLWIVGNSEQDSD